MGFPNCDTNFESKVEEFLDELEGIGGFSKESFKNTYEFLTQINADDVYFISSLIDNIKTTFPPNKWAQWFENIVGSGLAVYCEGGDIYVGSIDAIDKLTNPPSSSTSGSVIGGGIF